MDWKELTTNDKAELISLFVKNGITDINQMRRLYANGGDKTTLNNPRYNRDAEDRIYAYIVLFFLSNLHMILYLTLYLHH